MVPAKLLSMWTSVCLRAEEASLWHILGWELGAQGEVCAGEKCLGVAGCSALHPSDPQLSAGRPDATPDSTRDCFLGSPWTIAGFTFLVC